MKMDYELLCRIPLFQGIVPDDLASMLQCLNARAAIYQKNELVLMEGQKVSSVGAVISGGVQVVKEDFMGNRSIMSEAGPGNIFAESYSCVQTESLPVTVVSTAESEVLWLDYWRIVTSCSTSCRFHTKLISNMLSIIATKNILLNQKITHMSMRTTREKLLSYLTDVSARKGRESFEIPFNRQELADYLCVDRSAMSNELSKLQAEGVLSFHKNRFTLNSATD